jgi:hypothetical protein
MALQFDLRYADAPGNLVLRLAAYPLAGDRTPFGPRLLFNVHTEYVQGSPPQRLLGVQGALLWDGADDGLRIPFHAGIPSITVAIPVSDDQLTRFEEFRAGRPPEFSLRLEALAQPVNGGETRILNAHAQRLSISRDEWAVVLNRCGFGLRRMVELPPPPGGLGGAWDDASKSLADSSSLFAAGHDEQAIAAVRKALERIVEAVAAAVGEPPRVGKGRFGPYVERVAERIKALPSGRHQNPYPLVAGLLSATFNFTSGYVHENVAPSQREEAAFALAIGTALYGFAARGTLAAAAAAAVDDDTT